MCYDYILDWIGAAKTWFAMYDDDCFSVIESNYIKVILDGSVCVIKRLLYKRDSAM